MVAVDLPGQPALDMSAAEREDYIRDFQKRFPSLTSFEMVEPEVGAEAPNGAAGEGRAR
jgi:AP2-associated kinase